MSYQLATVLFLITLLWPCMGYMSYATHALPPLMLAKEVKDLIEVEHYWASEKLDGIRAYWDGQQLMTRNGNPIYAPPWFVQSLPVTPLDGELWLGRGQFQKLASIVLDKIPKENEWKQVGFFVFDLPNNKMPFEQRQALLKDLVERSPVEHLQYVQQQQVFNKEQLDAMLANVIDGGGEGLMLRPPQSAYEKGRTSTLLKIKPRQDAEAIVLSYVPGKGRYKGMMGSIWVKDSTGKTFKIGTGFTLGDRQNPPPIGSTVTFQYRGKTDKGIPRFASYYRQKIIE